MSKQTSPGRRLRLGMVDGGTDEAANRRILGIS